VFSLDTFLRFATIIVLQYVSTHYVINLMLARCIFCKRAVSVGRLAVRGGRLTATSWTAVVSRRELWHPRHRAAVAALVADSSIFVTTTVSAPLAIEVFVTWDRPWAGALMDLYCRLGSFFRLRSLCRCYDNSTGFENLLCEKGCS